MFKLMFKSVKIVILCNSLFVYNINVNQEKMDNSRLGVIVILFIIYSFS